MITIFVFIFIITGNVFGAILFQDEYREEVDYSVGGFNEIAEAQIRGEMYLPRMEKELNYSSNIAALEQGQREKEWRSAPSHQQVVNNYLNTATAELRSQSELVDCSAPEIGSVSVEDNRSYTAGFSEPYITCRAEGTEARIKMSSEEIAVEALNNSYVPLSEVGVDLAEHLDEKDLPESWSPGTGSSSKSCGPSVDRSALDESAKDEARDDAIKDDDLADTVVSDFSLPEWIELESSESFDVSYNQESSDYDADCTYSVSCNCREVETEDGGTTTECDTCQESGVAYDVTYSAQVIDSILKYDLADRKEIERYKDPRKALEDGDIVYSDFDIDYDTDTRRDFNRWENEEITTEEAKEQIDGFEIPRDKIQRERKVLDSNAQLQTLHFKFNYLHEIN